MRTRALSLDKIHHKSGFSYLFLDSFITQVYMEFIMMALKINMEIAVGTGLDRIVILVYFVLVMGFGAYFGKYAKTTSDYFFGGKVFMVVNNYFNRCNRYWFA